MALWQSKRLSIERTGPLVVALVLGALLVASSSLSYRDAKQAAQAVAERQGMGLIRRLETTLGRHPDAQALATALDANRPLGLRYVAAIDHGRVVAEAGEPRLVGVTSDPGFPVMHGDRLRMFSHGPHLPGGPGGPHAGSPFGPPPPDGPPPFPPPPFDDQHPSGPPPRDFPPPPHGFHAGQLIVEIEPITSRETVRRALSVLWLSCGAAAFLTAAAVVLSAKARRAARVEAELLAQRHLARLGEMSAVLAHEIRNPLAALKGHAQLLAEEVQGGATAGRVARVVEGAVRLERLTNDLLAFARTGTLQIDDAADPVAVLDRAVRAVGGERIDVEAASAPATHPLDALRIEETLINLLDNALAVTPPGGRVQARVAAGDGGQLVFAVADQGPGIAADERDQIFEPFHTTKTRGTGLGLAVAKRIVDLHGGQIGVSDAPGGGAIFTVVLPPHHGPRAA
jgi:two-component system sensor histidine kinase HydH